MESAVKYLFITSRNKHETAILKALQVGLKKSGCAVAMEESENYKGPRMDIDVAVVIGVKGVSKKVMHDYLYVGANTIYMDKGYIRRKGTNGIMDLYRVSVNAFQPLAYMNRYKHDSARWKALHVKINDEKVIKNKGTILYAGSSQKYADFKRMGDVTEYGRKIINRIREYDKYKRAIVYRPKPSYANAVPISGTIYSPAAKRFTDELDRADMLVTHGSNACFEALLRGIPSIVLDDGITKQFSVKEIKNISEVKFPSKKGIKLFCSNLAYQQWSIDEIKTGEMGDYIKHVIEYLKK